MLLVLNIMNAQMNGSGYYRVQNKVTERYIRVIDDKGSVDLATTNADLGALETKKHFSNVVSDPASIIYITPAGDGYNMMAQGTSSYKIIGYYVKLYKNSNGTYRAYAQHSGLTKYLCDENTTYDEGVVLTNSNTTRDWYIKPVNEADGQYFALTPSLTIGNEYYTTIYAAFPFTLPSNMKAYYVDKVADGQAVWKEVKDGKVPASTAVYVKCASSNYANNKVTVADNGVTSLSGNLMKGVYFNNGTNKHNNQKAYDANTMRVLGVTSEGKLGFVTANYDFIPANTAYLVVPAGTPKELKLVSESEYKPVVTVQSVTLSKTSMTMYAGENYTLTATVLPADAANKAVTWTSSNSNVATVDANGVVKAIGYGKATITVTSEANKAATAKCEVQVYAPTTGVQLSATSKEMYVGESFVLTANTLPLSTSDGKIEWSVSNEKVVKRNADGSIVAIGAGEANVTAKSVNGGYTQVCRVTVKAIPVAEAVTISKDEMTMYAGDVYTLTATVTPADAVDKALKWATTNNNVVTVDNGVVKAVAYGTANVVVSVASNAKLTDECAVTVYEHVSGVELTATNIQLNVGETAILTAQLLPLGKTDGRMEWRVSNENVARRNADGTIVAVSEGETEVIVKALDVGKEAKCVVKVNANSGLEDVIAGGAMSYKIYNMQGVELDALKQGVNIVKCADGTVKKVIVK